MDGGRILRALLATRMGLLRATRVAAGVGRVFALLMGAVGLFGGSIFLVVIAVFVWAGARAEERSVVMTSTLEGVTLEELMTAAPASVPAEASVEDALHVMLESKHLALPVTRDGRPVALLTTEMVSRVAADARRTTRVAEVASADLRTMRPHEEVARVLNDVMQAGLVAVTDTAGRLLGVITPTDIARAVRIRTMARA